MKPRALLVIAGFDAPARNHRQAQALKLVEQMIFRGMHVDIVCLDGNNDAWLFDLFGHCVRPLPLAKAREAGAYAFRVLDGLVAHDATAFPSAPVTVFLDPPNRPPEVAGQSIICRYSAPLEDGAILLPFESFDPDHVPAQAQVEAPALLCALEPDDTTAAAVAAFVRDVWPVMFELCPTLVLRLPRGFADRGVPADPGVEWIVIAGRDELDAHVARALAVLVPAALGGAAAQKIALALGAGRPVLSPAGSVAAADACLMYRHAREAAMLAFRLLADTAYREARVADALAGARDHFRKQLVYDAFNKALQLGRLPGLFEASNPDRRLEVPASCGPSAGPAPGTLPCHVPGGDGSIETVSHDRPGDVFGCGFAPAEGEAAWIVGHTGMFRVDLSGMEVGRQLDCLFVMGASEAARPGDQLVTIHVNGAEAAVWRVPRGEAFHQYRLGLDLPEGGLAGPLVVAISASDPARPHAHGAMLDERRLGAALKRLRFVPAGTA
ncbi:MAG: hypothetical protein EP335_01560 [Alphaproteobacteria bacterium]|nr:MAG: hypothetical protein EP335_01560 [Alphaproteobacteria bacterium]